MKEITDDSMLIEQYGGVKYALWRVLMKAKITTPEDILVAEKILEKNLKALHILSIHGNILPVADTSEVLNRYRSGQNQAGPLKTRCPQGRVGSISTLSCLEVFFTNWIIYN